MGRKIETRGKVKETKAQHEKEGQEKAKQLEATREDKDTASATGKELNQAGTREGKQAVKKAMEAVGEKIDRHMEKRSGEARKITAEGTAQATELGAAKKQTEVDRGRVEGAAGKVKERESGAAEGLREAAKQAAEEAKFLADFEMQEKKLAEALEKKRADEERKTRATKVTAKS